MGPCARAPIPVGVGRLVAPDFGLTAVRQVGTWREEPWWGRRKAADMAEEVDSTIRENAGGPGSASADGVQVKDHSLPVCAFLKPAGHLEAASDTSPWRRPMGLPAGRQAPGCRRRDVYRLPEVHIISTRYMLYNYLY